MGWIVSFKEGPQAGFGRSLVRGSILNLVLFLLTMVAGFPTALISATASVTRGPYLQMGTPTSLVVRWRTDVASDSRVRYGTDPANLDRVADDPITTTEHEVSLTGLTPARQYHYSVGSTTATLAGGMDYRFVTAPAVGTDQPTRIWVLGDSGTAGAKAAAVRNAYLNFTGARYTGLWLMLGDNAYRSGTDIEYQDAVFNMFPTTLRQSVLWPTIGNHDTSSTTNAPPSLPYFQIFRLPTNGEAGGVPSGTERYYSFDYANIHFICLDSMTSDRSRSGPMLTWLQDDLASTIQDWIIAFWHHPPYSKGSHDSDTSSKLTDMRRNVLPILEAGGVDLVLSGHSHSYERSFLLNGHYGVSSALTEAMKLDSGSGREDHTGAYTKPAGGPAANQGAVYVVAGSSGKIGGGLLNHPAMYISLNNLGSLVLDVNGNRLDVKFLRETGAIDDYFTLLKSGGNAPPAVNIIDPANGARFTQPVDIRIRADVADSDGIVVQVDFYSESTLIGTDTSAPFAVSWLNAPAGTHSLAAVATDNLGAATVSPSVSIIVNASNPPAAPTGLIATAGDARVSLGWSASSLANGYNLKRGTISGGPYSLVTRGITTLSYTDVTVSNGTTYYYVVSATNAAGESANSAQVSATPQAPPAPPAAPEGLGIDDISQTQLDLDWKDKSNNEAGFRIERSLTESNFVEIAVVGPNVNIYSDTGLVADTEYYYRMRAYNVGGYSPYSSVKHKATDHP